MTEPEVKKEVVHLAQAPRKNYNENSGNLTDTFLANMTSNKLKKNQSIKWEVNGFPMVEYTNSPKIDLKEVMAENPSKIRMSVEENGVEIQSITYNLKQDTFGKTLIDGEKLENKVLMGDMPEAHAMEDAH